MLVSVGSMAETIRRTEDKEKRHIQLSRKDETIIKIIYSIANKYHETFCNPKLKTIMDIAKRRYKITISERNLRLHMRTLEAKGLLIVRKSCGRTPDGTFIGKPNFYFVTAKMRKFLKGIIKQTAIWISKDNSLLNKVFDNFRSTTIELYQYAHKKYMTGNKGIRTKKQEKSEEDKMIEQAQRRLMQKKAFLGV